MFVDLNIPWPDIAPNSAYSKVSAVLKMLDTLGYDVVALNSIVPNVKSAKEFYKKHITDEIWNKLVSENKNLKLLKRVTVILTDTSPHQNLTQLIEDGWDVVAVSPKTEKQLQSCAYSLDVDIISIDTKMRLPFVLKHKLVCSAVSRGVRFEICYSDAVTPNAKQCIANSTMLFRASRNRGVVVSSGASSITQLRAPMDVVNLVTLWGLKSSAAYSSVSKSPEAAAVQGILRTTSAKQTVISPPKTLTPSIPLNGKKKETSASQPAAKRVKKSSTRVN